MRLTNKAILIQSLIVLVLLALSFRIKNILVVPAFTINQQTQAYNFNAVSIKMMSLGNKRFVAALMWISTMMSSDLDHYQEGDLKSWMYLRFDAITELSPKFYSAYLDGGLYLSVVKDDDEGAEKIFQKGLKYFPNDGLLNYYYAFHSYYEMGKVDQAIEHFERVLQGPLAYRYRYFLPSLVGRLKAEKNDLGNAYDLLLRAHDEAPEGSLLRERLLHSLYAIKAEMDLDCLNSKKIGCSKTDNEGNPYLHKDGKWSASKQWRPFRVFKRKDQTPLNTQ